MNDITAAPLVLTAEAIAAIPPQPLGSLPHVRHRVLWSQHTSTAGVLTVERGQRLGRHAHRVNHHHMWVLAGHATVLGAEVGPGTYVHVPAGVEHDIDASSSEGCTVFYLYLAPGT